MKTLNKWYFLKIWKMNKEILPDKNEASWLYAVTKKNEAITFLKKQKKYN